MAVTLTYGVNAGALSATANRATIFTCPATCQSVLVVMPTDGKFFYGVQEIEDNADVSASAAYLDIPAGTPVEIGVTREEFGSPRTFALASATSGATYRIAPSSVGG
jgi:hypothetical protein